MTLTACDVSTYQVPVNDSYPHRWLIFRVCDGDYPDSKAPANLRWAVAARKSGKLDGFTVYCVYRPGENAAILDHLNTFNVPTDCKIMIDAESWGGQITGNRSPELNALATLIAKRQGSQDRVWGYANRSDWNTIWPDRPKWLGLVVASYGGSKPTNPGPGPLVGWQYTDGQYTVPGLPNSSTPFGACDHNQLYITEGLTMDPDVKARFDKIDADYLKLWARLNALFAVDTNGDGKPDITGTVQGAAQYALAQKTASIAAAVYAKLPAAAKGGLTQSDVSAAVKAALQEGTGK